jgi:hypothetical protein
VAAWSERVLLALVVCAGIMGAAPADAAAPDYESFYDQFSTLVPDSSKVATVASLELARDAGIIVLEEGRLALCRPVGDRVCAAVFEGRGVFAFTPPTWIERGQLQRVLGVKALRRTFTSACFIFDDSTLAELNGALTFGPGVVGEEARKTLRDAVRTLVYEKAREVDVSIAHALLDGPPGLFFAMFAAAKSDPIAFEISPLYGEPVMLLRPIRDLSVGMLGRPRLEAVNQFRRADDTTSAAASDRRTTIAIRQVTADLTVTSKPAFAAHASLDFEALEDGQRWVLLTLDELLQVRRADWGDGRPASWRKGDRSPYLWIECDPPLARGQRYALRLDYDGPILERTDDWIHFHSIRAATGWYPWQGSDQAAIFDLTYHVARPLELVSVGERALVEPGERVTKSHWVTAEPVRSASFNLGFFKAYEVKDARIPPVTVMMSSRGHAVLADSLASEAEAPGKDMEKQVAADVANSLLFFQSRLGPAGFKQFYATELLADHGEAFPGLIHLATATFHSPSPGSADALFRAHEVAHQWWGVGVTPATYHDAWLSEAFAEFSALWFVQFSAHDNRRYFETLEDWRKLIVGNRKFVFGSGQQANPIWLGPRTESSATEGDYDLIIYEKGAWVLHMLRNLMLDLDTMKEDRFGGLMREFFQAHRGGEATTEEFRALAEQHVGGDLGWFFDQWVYGTDIPKYRFAWKSAHSTDSTWTVRCRVEQTNVPDGFRMSVPIQVEFADGKFTRTRAWIQGPTREFDLPPLPLEPRKVTFNDMASVLCEVENVKW